MKNARWLITLADLLTLLLCFALATVSLSDNSVKVLTPRNQSENVSTAPPLTKPGTPIAQDQHGVRVSPAPIALPLGAEDFEPSSARLTPGAWDRVKSRAEPAQYRFTHADIESCGDGSKAEAWYGAVEQAMTVRRQLIDIGVPSRSIRVRTRGPACSSGVVMNLIFNRE